MVPLKILSVVVLIVVVLSFVLVKMMLVDLPFSSKLSGFIVLVECWVIVRVVKVDLVKLILSMLG